MPRKLTKAAAAELYDRLSIDAPTEETELYFKDPYTLVVAVALSAQATDVGVNRATKVLFDVADTPQKMVNLGEDALGDYIKTIGLWRNKAKNVIALSQMLIDDFGGEVPENRDDLEKLPGVGRKTANVVCNVAFGQPTIAVDTHIFRVGNRTGLAPGKTPLDVEKGLERITPDHYRHPAHIWLILHGRYICKARKPECWRCKISDICLYKDKTPAIDDAKTKKSGPSRSTPAKRKASKPKTAKKSSPKSKQRAAATKRQRPSKGTRS